MNHLIQRQYIHLDLQGSESEGFALQNRLPELCAQWLPAMERVLDRLAPASGRLYVERLELDLGAIPFGQLEQELPEAVARALEKALSEHIPPGEATSGRDGGGSQSADTANVRLKSERQVALEAFLHFLETGRLPWSFRLPSGAGLEEFLLTAWMDKSGNNISSGQAGGIGDQAGIGISATAFAPVLRATSARRRLVLQFSEIFLERLLQRISPETHAVVSRLRTGLRAAGVSGRGNTELNSFQKQLWETAFEQAVAATVTITGESGSASLAAMVLAAEPKAAPIVLPALKEVLSPQLSLFINQLRERAGEKFSALIPSLKTVFGASSLPVTQPVRVKKSATERPKVDLPIPSVRAEQGEAPPATSRPKEFPSLASVPEEGVYVDNAGLVILHPFLQMFFEGLGIARDGALQQPGRALHLLHYLCTGQTPAPEYELTLPKILCNVPLESPVEADIVLTDNEIEESGALLQAAIRWWEALRNTGSDTLRGAFLCRPGKLSVRDDGDWLLQVERQSYDVLLDHLPWGISAVRLPWMEKMLWVEWG